VGVSHTHPGADNAQALASVASVLADLREGLVFANLIETDQVYGHRKDADGFARALRAIDESVGELLLALSERDLLIVTADHGVDPAHPGTDHTREHVPLLAATGAMVRARADGAGRRHDGPFADVGATVLGWLAGRDAVTLPGRSFLS